MKRTIRRSAGQWAELIEAYRGSVMSEQDFCRQHGLALVTFRKWRYRYSEPAPGVDSAPPSSGFVKLVSPDGAANDKVTVRVGKDITVEYPVSHGVESIARLIMTLRDGR